ncbi:hypothetical protein EDEG_00002 [Edhazardia aedis USNM 41457]|uniref:Uncharacterized protein n=1 Tax=Edhazardia aedis (strain USNM 41457) TaxID=1003232 RepID=J9A0E7_EDHAE|nr:hypothetical protein EDEG_00002 [Edhazardia aedis USNM 41457]|eukprot:EJW05393.1 hypothetical protein EDEG_00002 [Edhazardia aedis USNM 41457]
MIVHRLNEHLFSKDKILETENNTNLPYKKTVDLSEKNNDCLLDIINNRFYSYQSAKTSFYELPFKILIKDKPENFFRKEKINKKEFFLSKLIRNLGSYTDTLFYLYTNYLVFLSEGNIVFLKSLHELLIKNVFRVGVFLDQKTCNVSCCNSDNIICIKNKTFSKENETNEYSSSLHVQNAANAKSEDQSDVKQQNISENTDQTYVKLSNNNGSYEFNLEKKCDIKIVKNSLCNLPVKNNLLVSTIKLSDRKFFEEFMLKIVEMQLKNVFIFVLIKAVSYKFVHKDEIVDLSKIEFLQGFNVLQNKISNKLDQIGNYNIENDLQIKIDNKLDQKTNYNIEKDLQTKIDNNLNQKSHFITNKDLQNKFDNNLEQINRSETFYDAHKGLQNKIDNKLDQKTNYNIEKDLQTKIDNNLNQKSHFITNKDLQNKFNDKLEHKIYFGIQNDTQNNYPTSKNKNILNNTEFDSNNTINNNNPDLKNKFTAIMHYEESCKPVSLDIMEFKRLKIDSLILKIMKENSLFIDDEIGTLFVHFFYLTDNFKGLMGLTKIFNTAKPVFSYFYNKLLDYNVISINTDLINLNIHENEDFTLEKNHNTHLNSDKKIIEHNKHIISFLDTNPHRKNIKTDKNIFYKSEKQILCPINSQKNWETLSVEKLIEMFNNNVLFNLNLTKPRTLIDFYLSSKTFLNYRHLENKILKLKSEKYKENCPLSYIDDIKEKLTIIIILDHLFDNDTLHKYSLYCVNLLSNSLVVLMHFFLSNLFVLDVISDYKFRDQLLDKLYIKDLGKKSTENYNKNQANTKNSKNDNLSSETFASSRENMSIGIQKNLQNGNQISDSAKNTSDNDNTNESLQNSHQNTSQSIGKSTTTDDLTIKTPLNQLNISDNKKSENYKNSDSNDQGTPKGNTPIINTKNDEYKKKPLILEDPKLIVNLSESNNNEISKNNDSEANKEIINDSKGLIDLKNIKLKGLKNTILSVFDMSSKGKQIDEVSEDSKNTQFASEKHSYTFTSIGKIIEKRIQKHFQGQNICVCNQNHNIDLNLFLDIISLYYNNLAHFNQNSVQNTDPVEQNKIPNNSDSHNRSNDKLNLISLDNVNNMENRNNLVNITNKTNTVNLNIQNTTSSEHFKVSVNEKHSKTNHNIKNDKNIIKTNNIEELTEKKSETNHNDQKSMVELDENFKTLNISDNSNKNKQNENVKDDEIFEL